MMNSIMMSIINLTTSDDEDFLKLTIKAFYQAILKIPGEDGENYLIADLAGTSMLTRQSGLLSTAVIGLAPIMEGVFTPGVIAFLTVIFTINFAKVLMSLDHSDSSGGIQRMVQIVIKYAVLVAVAKKAIVVVHAIAAVIDNLIMKASTFEADPSSKTEPKYEGLYKAIDGIGTISGITVIIILILPLFIAFLAGLVTYVVVIMRFAEFIFMGAAAPLSIAFLGDEDTKSIGIGYLKKMFSVGLQGVMIVLVPAVTALLPGTEHAADFTDVDSSNLMMFTLKNFLVLLVTPVVQLVLVFSAMKMAKAVMGE